MRLPYLSSELSTPTVEFELTSGSQGPVATIVKRLDGLPLAIELAAAQLDAISLDDLVGGLDDRFALLVGQTRGVSGEAGVVGGQRGMELPTA